MHLVGDAVPSERLDTEEYEEGQVRQFFLGLANYPFVCLVLKGDTFEVVCKGVPESAVRKITSLVDALNEETDAT